MRKILGSALAVAVCAAPAWAGDRYLLRQDQSGLTLPGVQLPQGYDEVHAADGTSCRSSNTGAGAYADVGVIGSNDQVGAMQAGSVYGRVVIPLGANGTRLDCRKLYDLEIQRLQTEVRLLKAGLGQGNPQTAAQAEASGELTNGWTNSGRQPGAEQAASAGPGDAPAGAAAGADPQTVGSVVTDAPAPARGTRAEPKQLAKKTAGASARSAAAAHVDRGELRGSLAGD